VAAVITTRCDWAHLRHIRDVAISHRELYYRDFPAGRVHRGPRMMSSIAVRALAALLVAPCAGLRVLYGITERGGPGGGDCGTVMDTDVFDRLSAKTQSCLDHSFIVLYGQCSDEPNNLTNVVLPPIGTVGHDHPSPSDWKNWSASWQQWQLNHGSQIDLWLDRKVPQDFSGFLAIDYEGWEFNWTMELKDHGLHCDSCGAWVGQPGTNDCNACNWMNLTSAVNTPMFDGAFVKLAGFSPPSGARGWMDLTEAAQQSLIASSWSYFARQVHQQTIQRTKQRRPRAKVGWYSLPRPMPAQATAADRAAVRAQNDELAWLWRMSDWLGPSIYAKRWTTSAPAPAPPGCPADTTEVETDWMNDTIREQLRVQRAYNPQAAIVPWITFTYGFSAGACRYTYLNQLNAQLQTSVPAAADGVDAVIFWGGYDYNVTKAAEIAAYIDANMSVCV
jgi:hypothetical protein